MTKEIERKFLVTSDAYRNSGIKTLYSQGYLSTDPGRTVRVRIAGDLAYLTIKSKAQGITRDEFEYEIPLDDAETMLENLCIQPIIKKIRYQVPFGGFTWEVDEFSGDNAGLVVAEIELPKEDTPFQKPSWLGEEVSQDRRYANSNLVQNPYKNWK